ncbi:MAG TPA: hypothetical protein VFE32_00640 [Puia sp.]|jgi:hypothetical protein|nr:hypothetical protein [Puia sp.]
MNIHSLLLTIALSCPLLSVAQKVTKDIRPDSHQVWLVTDDVNLNFRVIQLGAVYAHFRTEGPDIFLYLTGAGQLSPRDYAYFVTDGDTVTIYSTGTQPGGWNGNNPYHEYKITRDALTYLSLHPLKTVVISHYGGWDSVDIPVKDKSRFQPYCAAVLKNLP